MKKVRVSAKPKYTKNYITIQSVREPVFCTEGTGLTAIRPVESPVRVSPAARLRQVPIPEHIEAIGADVFSGLDSLQGVFFGAAPYLLGSGVFAGCTGLKTVELAEGTEKVPYGSFCDCTGLQTVRLPRSVTRINMNAFKNCRSLSHIDLPENLEQIEVSAFWGCHSLEELLLPDTVKEVDGDAFASCINLKNVRLSASLKKLGGCAFHNCVRLEEIVIPEGVTALPMGVFAGCRNLRRIVLPDTLEYISPYAFYRCEALEYVECGNAERFARALEGTPFWRKTGLRKAGPARFPMELLNHFAGEVPGPVLNAMGYPLFDIDKKYRFTQWDRPGVIEVRARELDAEYPENARYEKFWINEALEPIPEFALTALEEDLWESVF